ncbi:MAG TPA: transporter substrate-binding domain-containing protein [Roseateles sp.]
MFRQARLLLSALALAGLPVWAQDPLDSGAAEPHLEWVAGDLPPFAWRASGVAQGYAQELAQQMAQQLGRPGEVSYYPWARAVRMVERGDHFGIFPLARTPDREKRFQWLVPLMTVRYALVTLASERRLSLAELRPLRVGVLRGSPIISNLRAEHFTKIVEGTDYKDLLRMLIAGTLDVIYAGAPMLGAAMDAYGHPRSRFTTHQTLGAAELYMAASAGLSAEEAQRWQRAYQQLEKDGSVERLRRRYGLNRSGNDN